MLIQGIGETIYQAAGATQGEDIWVMSSRLCKYSEGAGFPFQVESLEDGVDDSVHGLHIDEADHGAGSSADFDETAFDDIGGAQLAPQMLGKTVKGQQFSQVAL